MVRNVLGGLVALIGAAAAVWSPFRPWYDGRHGSDIRIDDLFGGITGDSAELFGSLLLPMLFAAVLTLIGVMLRARLMVALAGVVVLGFTVLWMVRQGQAAGELTAGTDGGLGVGAASALGGGALLLLAALIMRGRRHRVDDGHGRYDDGYYGRPERDQYGWDDRYGREDQYARDDQYAGDDRYSRDDGYDEERPTAPQPLVQDHPVADDRGQRPYPTGAGPAAEPPPGGAYPPQGQPTAPWPEPPQQTWEQPTRPAHPQPPTPPVQWGKEHRQPRRPHPHDPRQDPHDERR
ncbi:hypothetical protein [Streptomyces sp. NPDC017993]|uniref:hypothetical protein n=1 Tax=Streptomyces sp. NPDC017993 TaxID=3365027 RepID=UPI0037B65374